MPVLRNSKSVSSVSINDILKGGAAGSVEGVDAPEPPELEEGVTEP